MSDTYRMTSLLHRRFIIPSLMVLTVLIVIVALVAPPDKMLGDRVRLVYVHGAIIRVVLATFVLSGALGAFYLFTNRSAAFDWSRALQEASLALWIIYLVVSTITTIQTWGGIAWFEPRWTFTLQMTGLAPIAYLAGRVLKHDRIAAALNAIVAAVMLFLLSQARLIIHPVDPIGASGDAAIESAYFIMLVLWALVGVQFVRGTRALAIRRIEP
jgi:hypothetical protein